MNEREFNQWVDTLFEAFPGSATYVHEHPRMLAHWAAALSGVRFDHATQAITEMVREGKPFPDNVPSVVIRHCLGQRLTAPTIEHHERNNCRFCADSGTHFAWVCGFDQRATDPTWRYANVACTCSAGTRWTEDRKQPSGKTLPGLPRFDSLQHVMTESRHHHPQASDLTLLAESGLPGATEHAEWHTGGRTGRKPVVSVPAGNQFDDWNNG